MSVDPQPDLVKRADCVFLCLFPVTSPYWRATWKPGMAFTCFSSFLVTNA